MDATTLPVMERFYSVQGEGAFTGHAAFFIRLGGCDVGCVWCDVKDSWDANKHPFVHVQELIEEVKASGAPICVVTGGEPTMHDLSQLTQGLQELGIRTHLETSGTGSLTGSWDWITFSPKKFKAPLDIYFDRSHELKVIVYHASDISWAEELRMKSHSAMKCYLQPEWEKRTKSEALIFEYVRQNPRWAISLQTHKYLGVD
jgi:organic radical activating enzyme